MLSSFWAISSILYTRRRLQSVVEVTRYSAIAERSRCRVRYSFGQKWKTGPGKQWFTDIIGLSSTTVTLSAWKSIEFREKSKIIAITAFKVIQGHLDRYQSKDRMRLPISD